MCCEWLGGGRPSYGPTIKPRETSNTKLEKNFVLFFPYLERLPLFGS